MEDNNNQKELNTTINDINKYNDNNLNEDEDKVAVDASGTVFLTKNYLRWNSLPVESHPISGSPDERDLALIKTINASDPKPWSAPYGTS